jgi:predicted SAM-dependent methyltransferase
MSPPYEKQLCHWLSSNRFGQYLLAHEMAFHRDVGIKLGRIHYAMQIGLADIDLLTHYNVNVGYTIGKDLFCNYDTLAIADNSIDVIICAHSIDSQLYYQPLLNECYRVLHHNGKLVISGFNHGGIIAKYIRYRNYVLPRRYHQNYLHYTCNLDLLYNQLNKANFVSSNGKFFAYSLPFISNDRLQRYCEQLGDRYLPTYAHLYGIVGYKKILPLDYQINPHHVCPIAYC